MPLFYFECKACETIMERYTPSYEVETVACPCGKEAERLVKLYPPTLIFQGSGFYKTDYK